MATMYDYAVLYRQGYILTNLINMSVKLFSTVSIVFFPVDFKSARYHSRICILNKLICIFPKWPPIKVIGYEYSPGNLRNVFFGPKLRF